MLGTGPRCSVRGPGAQFGTRGSIQGPGDRFRAQVLGSGARDWFRAQVLNSGPRCSVQGPGLDSGPRCSVQGPGAQLGVQGSIQELEQELCGLEGPPALGGSVNLGVEDVSYCALNISNENIMQISILSVRPS